jgi:hypothetical protein
MPIPTRRGDRGGRGRRDQALIRKTSLLRDRSDVRAVKQRTTCTLARDIQHDLSVAQNVTPRCWRLRARAGTHSRPNARSDLLFTMSENTHAASDDATGERCVLPDEPPAGGARRDRTDDLLLAKQALSQLSYGPAARNACNPVRVGRELREMVGLGRFELPTSRLSSARSNQLSYKPKTKAPNAGSMAWRTADVPRNRDDHRDRAAHMARARPRRKRNGDGGVPPMDIYGLRPQCPDVSKRSDRDA